jgi:hypothetical protein
LIRFERDYAVDSVSEVRIHRARVLTARQRDLHLRRSQRSQVNLDQKVRVTDKGGKNTFGFAKYLHDSLPNATYVGFIDTPIDRDEVYKEIFEQAENFKKYQSQRDGE